MDLSRTVGWFTSLFPVRLDPGAIDSDEAWREEPRLGRALKRVKEQLRAVPGQRAGLWVAALSERAGAGGSWAGMRTRRRSASTTWVGLRRRWRRTVGADWAIARETAAWAILLVRWMPAMPLAHLLEVNAVTTDGPERAGAECELELGADRS